MGHPGAGPELPCPQCLLAHPPATLSRHTSLSGIPEPLIPVFWSETDINTLLYVCIHIFIVYRKNLQSYIYIHTKNLKVYIYFKVL